MKKILLILLSVFSLAVLVFLIFFNLKFPDVEKAPNIKVDMSEKNIKRGEYLANSVSGCVECHSVRDWSMYSGPVKEGTIGMGGEEFNEEMGLPGNYYSSNITPSGIGDWTDGEIYRAIVSGVSKDGKALFPIMPYPNFAKMSKDDIYSIIAYLRTLKPIEHKVKESTSNFPMNIIVNLIPQNVNSHTNINYSNEVEYGKYVFNAASCNDCHTPMDKGEFITEKALAGGNEFKMPFGINKAANISADKETGIGLWTKEQFIFTFKSFELNKHPASTVKYGEKNTIMPWTSYSNMTEEDLGAIYEYIMSLKPQKNKVTTFTKL